MGTMESPGQGEAIVDGTLEQHRRNNSSSIPVSDAPSKNRDPLEIEVAQEQETLPIFVAVDLFDR